MSRGGEQVRIRWGPAPGGPPLPHELVEVEEEEDEEDYDYEDDYDDSDDYDDYDDDGYYYYDDDEEELLSRRHTLRVSISVPDVEEERLWRGVTPCLTYPMMLQWPRVSFLLPGLLVMALTLWWLIFV